MKDPENMLKQLPQIADDAFGDIQATQGLRNRILEAAEKEEGGRVKNAFLLRRVLPVAAGVLVVAAGTVGALGVFTPKRQEKTVSAGKMIVSSDMVNVLSEGALADGNPEGDSFAVLRQLTTMAAGQLPRPDSSSEKADVGGNVSIYSSQTAAYRSVWDQNGVLAVNNAYYRMLTAPSSASSSLKGSSLGTVQSYTAQPELIGGIRSSVVPEGTPVYTVSGMDGTAVLAEVNGRLRVFQRVSAAGSAVSGNETLRDTLKGNVTRMTLSDVGALEGQAARDAARVLFSGASYAGSGCGTSGQTLLIEMDNGITLQMFVSGKKLMACGTWSCPEFFDAFEAGLK